MHPHIETWGSILRLYGSRTDEVAGDDATTQSGPSSTNEKQSGEKTNPTNGHKAKPNRELLEKLREEMKKLKRTNENSQSNSTGIIVAGQPNSMLLLNTLATIPPLIIKSEKLTEAKTSERDERSDDGVIAVVKCDNDNGDDKKKNLKPESRIKRKLSDDDDDEDEDGDEDESDTSTSSGSSHSSSSGSETGEDSDDESSGSGTSNDDDDEDDD